MSAHVAIVELPKELVREIDSIVGSESRSAFLVETAQAELRRRRLLEFLRSDEPAWKDEDRPELANGSVDWVRRLRGESDRRIPSFEPETVAD